MSEIEFDHDDALDDEPLDDEERALKFGEEHSDEEQDDADEDLDLD